jgi:fibronectin-binding autotransporter adhesin
MCDTFATRSSWYAASSSAVPLLSLLAAFLFLVTGPLHADTYNWIVPAGNWSSYANWRDISNPGVATPPVSSGTAFIANNGTATITQFGATCGTLSLGGTAGSGAMQMTGGGLSIVGFEIVGDSGAGSFTQNAGINYAGSSVWLGNNPGSSGTYNLSGSGLFLPRFQVEVGWSGIGTFTQSGGTLSTGIVDLGSTLTGSGTYSLSGNGQISASIAESVGSSGVGTFTQSGGTNSITGQLVLGVATGATGTYSLAGSLLTANGEYVGQSGTGTFAQSGGINIVKSSLWLGASSGGKGSYSLSGSGQLSAPNEWIGGNGTGTFVQTGGTNTIGDLLGLGYNPTGSGTYSLSGGMLVLPRLAHSGVATFNFSGGTLQASGGFSTDVRVTLGDGSDATFDTAGYTVSLAGPLSGPGSLVKVGSGTLIVAAGSTRTGPTAINGGVLSLANATALSGSGNITFSGGTLQYSSSNNQDCSGRITGSAGPISIDTNGANVIFASSLASSNTGGLTKFGSGNLTLSASNSITGPTAINGGILSLADSAALPAGGSITFGGGILKYANTNNSDYSAAIVGSTGPISIDTNGGNIILASSLASSNSGGLTKFGSGVLTLAAGNSYAGTTTINGGVLSLANSMALPVGGNITFGGGTLQYSNTKSNDYSSAIAGSTGPISIDTNGANVIFTSSLASSNSGGLTKAGSGTLTLAAVNSYAGTTTISGGVLALANSAALPAGGNITFAGGTLQYSNSNCQDYSATMVGSTSSILIDTNGVNVTFGSNLAGSNSGGLTKIGDGALNLAAANNFSGKTLVSGGTLALGNPLALQQSTLDTSGSGTISFGSLTSATLRGLTGSGTLSLINASSGSLALSVGNANADATYAGMLDGVGSLRKIGNGKLLLCGSNSYTGGTMISAGILSLANSTALPLGGSIMFGGGTLQYSGSNIQDYSGAIVGSTNPIMIDTNGANVEYAASLARNNNGGLTKLGSGTLTLIGSNDYLGTTTINRGTLTLGNPAALPLGGKVTFGGGTLQYSSNNSNDYSGNVLDSSGPISIDTNGVNVTFASNLAGSNTGGLTKIGDGSLTLAGGNTFSGNTSVSGGTLVLEDPRALQQSVLDTSGSGTVSFGSLTSATLGGLTGSGTFSLVNSSSNALALAVGNHGASTTFSGALNGAGSLTKLGGGALLLSGSNTYTGGTLVSAGTLEAATAAALAGYATPGTITVASGAVLAVGAGGTGWTAASIGTLLGSNGSGFAGDSIFGIDTSGGSLAYSANIPSNLILAKLGGNLLMLAGTNAYAAPTVVTGGTLQIGDGQTSGSVAVDITDNSIVAFSRSDSVTFDNVISGTGSVIQAGVGTLIFTGSNTYTGGTTITRGTLQIGNGGNGAVIGSTSAVTDNGCMVFNHGDILTVNQRIGGSGSLTKIGSGLLILANLDSYTGTTTIDGGTLQLGNGGSLSATSKIYVGYAGTGTFLQTGGTSGNKSSLYLGYNTGSSGTYSFNGSGLLSASGAGETIGYSGTGTFLQTGGTNSAYTNNGTSIALYLGYNNGSSGTYSLSGSGLLSATGETIGYSGTGTFIQTCGTNNCRTSSIYLAYKLGSSGTYLLSGGSLASEGGETIGYSGMGTFTQSGGTNAAAQVDLGLNAGSRGTYDLNGNGQFSAHNENVGGSGTGTFTQSGGTHSVLGTLALANGASGRGSFALGGGMLSSGSQYVGYSGVGNFTQTGGTNAAGAQYIGLTSNSSSYSLSGPSLLSATTQYIGYYGTGILTQTGGTNAVGTSLSVGYGGGNGTYYLSGGALSAPLEYVGQMGTTGIGAFVQTGGSNTIVGSLHVGDSNRGRSNYSLGGSGLLTAAAEYVSGGSASILQQSGGLNATAYMSIASGSTLQLSGGTLQIGQNLIDQGVFSGSGGSGTLLLSANAWADFSRATIVNGQNVSVSAGENSLVIVPAGFNPTTGFGNYSSLGITHTIGTTLSIAAGQQLSGSGAITDPVDCKGAVLALSGGSLNLSGGLSLSGTGTASLGGGTLTSNIASSGISGGSLAAGNLSIGSSAVGFFTQTGGISSINKSLFLGYNSGGTGNYALGNTSLLSAPSEYLGYSGTGSFTQTGGTNNVGTLWMAYNSGSRATYTLSGSGHLMADTEWVGYSSSGTFSQTGGTNTVATALYFGNSVGGGGTYSLSGDSLLSAPAEYLGHYDAFSLLQQTGGLNETAYFSLSRGTLQMGGGTLQIDGNLQNQGTIDGSLGGGLISIAGSACAYFGSGSASLQMTHSLSVTAGPNSLVIVPAGFNPSTMFANYTSLGLTHTAGTTLVVPAGRGFACATTIDDPVNCQGTILATSGGSINLSNGLTLSGTGVVNLGGGALSVSDKNSGMSGGSLAAAWESLFGDPAIFTQSGGTNSVSGGLAISAGTSNQSGVYNLSGNSLLVSSSAEYVGYYSTGSFVHTGGTNSTPALYLGGTWAQGIYNLSGSGQLSAGAEYVGSNFIPGCQLLQNGGLNTASFLMINTASTVQVSAGTLQLSGGLVNQGTFDGAGGHGVINLAGSCIADFSQGAIVNAGSMAVTAGPNSLVIVPAGFSTSTGFASYVTLGLTYTGGTTLFVPAGQGFAGSGTVNDPVICQGTILATPGGTINLQNGLSLSGTAIANLGLGGLTVTSASSEMSGGSLVTASDTLGPYSGTGGSLTQTGGTHTVAGMLSVQYGGRYTLAGSALLAAANEQVIHGGVFTQNGGTNAVAGTLSLTDTGSPYGTYNLNGGLLVLSQLAANAQYSWFNFTGGTLRAASSFSSLEQFELSGSGATFDTAGYTVGIGRLFDVGSLTKLGSGTLILPVANAYTGPTIIDAGILSLADSAALAGGGAITFGGGTLQYTGKNNQDYSRRIVGSTGPISIDTNGMNVNFASSLGKSNSGGLTKIGMGMLILSASDSYAGGTIVIAGTLDVTNPDALPNGTSLTVAAETSVFGGAGAVAPVTSAMAVPEPSTIALFGVSAVGLLVLLFSQFRKSRCLTTGFKHILSQWMGVLRNRALGCPPGS